MTPLAQAVARLEKWNETPGIPGTYNGLKADLRLVLAAARATESEASDEELGRAMMTTEHGPDAWDRFAAYRGGWTHQASKFRAALAALGLRIVREAKP